jgi:hypothetical protein
MSSRRSSSCGRPGCCALSAGSTPRGGKAAVASEAPVSGKKAGLPLQRHSPASSPSSAGPAARRRMAGERRSGRRNARQAATNARRARDASTQSISPVGPHSQRNMPAGRSCGGRADGLGEGNGMDGAGGCGSREAVTAGGSSGATAGRSGTRSATQPRAPPPNHPRQVHGSHKRGGGRGAFRREQGDQCGGIRGPAMAPGCRCEHREGHFLHQLCNSRQCSIAKLGTRLAIVASEEFDQLSPLDRPPWASTAGWPRTVASRSSNRKNQAFREQKVTTSGMGPS